jgi:hypothetical protein
MADPARFDAVLTDEMLPGMAGSELARRLLALRPVLPESWSAATSMRRSSSARARPAWSPCCESRWACASWPNAGRRRSIAGEAGTCRHNAPAQTSGDTLYVPAACSNLAALERSLAHAPEELDAKGGPSGWTALACVRYSRLVTPTNGAASTLPKRAFPQAPSFRDGFFLEWLGNHAH